VRESCPERTAHYTDIIASVKQLSLLAQTFFFLPDKHVERLPKSGLSDAPPPLPQVVILLQIIVAPLA
ncbi:MAG TPA: hypothetical protein VIE65_11765, partial [Methylobacter sp.]